MSLTTPLHRASSGQPHQVTLLMTKPGVVGSLVRGEVTPKFHPKILTLYSVWTILASFSLGGTGRGKKPHTLRGLVRSPASRPCFPPRAAPGPSRLPQSRPPEGLGGGGWPLKRGSGRGRTPAKPISVAPHSPRQEALPGQGWGGGPVGWLTSVLGEEVALGPEPAVALTGLTGKEVLHPPHRGGGGRGYACAQAALRPLHRSNPSPHPPALG